MIVLLQGSGSLDLNRLSEQSIRCNSLFQNVSVSGSLAMLQRNSSPTAVTGSKEDASWTGSPTLLRESLLPPRADRPVCQITPTGLASPGSQSVVDHEKISASLGARELRKEVIRISQIAEAEYPGRFHNIGEVEPSILDGFIEVATVCTAIYVFAISIAAVQISVSRASPTCSCQLTVVLERNPGLPFPGALPSGIF